MKTVVPTPENLKAKLSQLPQDQPVTMLNLLQFRAKAYYDDTDSDLSGKQAYQIYIKTARAKIKALGGEVIWHQKAMATLIGPPEENWDETFLVRYPSVAAFISMMKDPEYQKAVKHRSAALADSRLIATFEQSMDE